MNYYIFRHAQTYQSKNNIPYGVHVETAKILPEGKKIIEKLAIFLKKINTDLNLSSPYFRCRETVEIVSRITDKKFIFDQKLGEFRADLESVENFISRIDKFLKEIEEKKVKSVLICTHGYPISALIQLISRGFVTRHELDNYPHPGVLVSIKNKDVKFTDFN